ncbi:MAG: 4-alpha-glucanotransferase [Treponema sp.]|nr:4-alpha-glucanotransferase [Treponema sp.]
MSTPIEIPRLTGTAIPLGALKTKRSCGIGEYPDLVAFASFCKKAGLSLIQLLPVNDTGTESSPYSALSAFALHPIYISIEALPEYKAVSTPVKKAVKALHQAHDTAPRFDYRQLRYGKLDVLKQVYEENKLAIAQLWSDSDSDLRRWFAKNPWVVEYAVFMELKWEFMEASWRQWPKKFSSMKQNKIVERWEDRNLRAAHLFHVWLQWRAFEQFQQAAEAVQEKGIMLKGDIPIMMNEDSADAWAHPEFFDDTMRAGSPPDGFNPTGQNWGFPVYRWKNLAKSDYSWWKNRLACASNFYQAYRIDHVLGFFRIWETSSRETTAILGRTEPSAPITFAELEKAGFDKDRIRWLSQPHVPTRAIEEVNNNDYLGTHGYLHLLMDRIGEEELWLFKEEIQGDRDILEREDIPEPVRYRLAEFWRNRTLLPLGQDKFLPLWTYRDTTAWKSLSEQEQESLDKLIATKQKKQDTLWEKQARTLLGELTSATDMIACAEDLGANPESVPRVLDDLSILRLCVVRWYRQWQEEGQPFVDFADYPAKSVVTASVHDSSTLRLWWLTEQDAADFYRDFPPEEAEGDIEVGIYTPETARYLLSRIATSASNFCIHPIQDFLALQAAYYHSDPQQERVNVPGSVNEFNWTYRLPVLVEELAQDKDLQVAIKEVVAIHKKAKASKKASAKKKV